MPGSATHITVVQRLAASSDLLASLLGDPSATDSSTMLQCRYANLGAIGPDMFYAMLDYGSQQQDFQDFLAKVAGTFSCISDVMTQIDGLIKGEVDTITLGVAGAVFSTFDLVVNVIKEGLLATLIESGASFWPFLEPARQKDLPREQWFWADYLHYVRTGCFAQKLVDICSRVDGPEGVDTSCLRAYAYGYLTHIVTDTIGHPYVNLIVQSPWRNYWQRHHLVENFIDTYVWERWHSPTLPPVTNQQAETPLDSLSSSPNAIGEGSALNFSRLNDFTNIGGMGFDDGFDAAIKKICDKIQAGKFDMATKEDLSFSTSEDATFQAWTKVMVEALWTTYPLIIPTNLPQDHPTNLAKGFTPRPGGYPTKDDIAASYAAFRFLLKVSTEDNVSPLEPPDLIGDLEAIASQVWASVEAALQSIPSPPPIPSGTNFSIDAALDALAKFATWVAEVAQAAGKALADVVLGAIQAGATVGADTIKYGLYVLSTLLFSLYRSFRDILVLQAYAVPFSDQLTATIGVVEGISLWKPTGDVDSVNVPVEETISERDYFWHRSHGPHPYLPSDPPRATNVFVEQPPVPPQAAVLGMRRPDDFLDAALGGDDMFSATGPAIAKQVTVSSPSGPKAIQTFEPMPMDKDFGGAIANCARAIHLAEGGWPGGSFLPDYNLDSDRGYAWPCWDVQNGSLLNPLDPPNAGSTIVDAALLTPAAPNCSYDSIATLDDPLLSQLQMGDILLYLGTENLKYEIFTYSIIADETIEIGPLCPYSHAAVVVEGSNGLEVAEMQETYARNSFYNSISPCDRVDVYRFIGITPDRQQAISDAAKSFSSQNKYAFITIGLLAYTSLNRSNTASNRAALQHLADEVDIVTGSGSVHKQMICSEMVARVYDTAKVPLTLTPWPTLASAGVLNSSDRLFSYTTPNMISRAPELTRLFGLSTLVPVSSE